MTRAQLAALAELIENYGANCAIDGEIKRHAGKLKEILAALRDAAMKPAPKDGDK